MLPITEQDNAVFLNNYSFRLRADSVNLADEINNFLGVLPSQFVIDSANSEKEVRIKYVGYSDTRLLPLISLSSLDYSTSSLFGIKTKNSFTVFLINYYTRELIWAITGGWVMDGRSYLGNINKYSANFLGRDYTGEIIEIYPGRPREFPEASTLPLLRSIYTEEIFIFDESLVSFDSGVDPETKFIRNSVRPWEIYLGIKNLQSMTICCRILAEVK